MEGYQKENILTKEKPTLASHYSGGLHFIYKQDVDEAISLLESELSKIESDVTSALPELLERAYDFLHDLINLHKKNQLAGLAANLEASLIFLLSVEGRLVETRI
ncbi:hypothetical protein NE237_024090 [Protea cynaroides]|uniref:Uncharacterized protein n=1 Tax=Protea cynaroides TaxID=273540 RepID=A0A9Q0HF87_9MAGN|nr:hypothetical protein NE237_024090 [Protea cynaroides]